MITRHPKEQELLQQYQSNRRLDLAQIMLGTGYRCTPSNPAKEVETDLQLTDFSYPDLAKPLSQIFGPSAGQVEGKYQNADFFAFECQGETILAQPEQGEKGTSWYYVIPKENRKVIDKDRFVSMEHPLLIHVLPAFFTELYSMLFQGELLDAGFSHEANHYRQVWRSEQQKRELDQQTPPAIQTLPRRSL